MRTERNGRPPRPPREQRYNRTQSRSTIIWASVHKWESLLEHDHSAFFNNACNKYPHYLDTAIHGMEVIKMGEDKKNYDDEYGNKLVTLLNPSNKLCAFTALDNDLFVPR